MAIASAKTLPVKNSTAYNSDNNSIMNIKVTQHDLLFDINILLFTIHVYYLLFQVKKIDTLQLICQLDSAVLWHTH